MKGKLEQMNREFDILAWTTEGELIANAPVNKRTIAISGTGDGDVNAPEIGACHAFLTKSAKGANLVFQSSDGFEETGTLTPGLPVKIGPITWMIAQKAASDDSNEFSDSLDELDLQATLPPYDRMMQDVISWLARPMSGAPDLRDGLKFFLETIVRNCGALHGMLVLSEHGSFTLAGCHGVQPDEAQKIWEKMPPALAEEILREKAKILLPDGFRQKSDGTSTIYMKGLRGIAGFPVIAEGNIVAIFYLGFESLLRSLTKELQTAIEAAADLLGIVIQRATLREEISALKLVLSASSSTETLPENRLMVGNSKALTQVYKLIRRLAAVDMPTLVLGETGTGKELVAKEIHRMSPRRCKGFIVVNAAALPENLVESELFGHKKGSFTGALSDRIGLIESAHEGTLFIDEIGELPLSVQSKLLRVLQGRSVTRVGDTVERPVDFRLVAATHRDLEAMVREGTFREDLYYRIAGAVIHIPALRERREDIIPLANFFKKNFSERHSIEDKDWSTDAIAALEANAWSGNVRELENTVARAFVMAEGRVIRKCDVLGTAEDIGIFDDENDLGLLKESLTDAREHWTRNYIIEALKRHGGKRGETARALGIGERTLFRYIEQYGIKDS